MTCDNLPARPIYLAPPIGQNLCLTAHALFIHNASVSFKKLYVKHSCEYQRLFLHTKDIVAALTAVCHDAEGQGCRKYWGGECGYKRLASIQGCDVAIHKKRHEISENELPDKQIAD